jgi:UDP-N-acetylmuramoylalanine--D-glutamate ligase
VAVVLNLAPDHLDRHGDLAAYRAAKARILANQEADDVAVLNAASPEVASMAEDARSRVMRFDRRGPPAEAGAGCAWFDAGAIRLRLGDELSRVPLDGLALPGLHNAENVMAALLATSAFGVAPATAAAALPDFAALPHRAETVASRGGVDWIDDSKATNPHAAASALESCERPVVWIAGGRDKGLDYDGLADVARDRVREAVLIGEAAPKLALALQGRVPCSDVGTLARAVARAAEVARDGDAVLLAPACASQDQFASYEDRGRAFREAVAALDATEGPR